jgi:hypothetical protein
MIAIDSTVSLVIDSLLYNCRGQNLRAKHPELQGSIENMGIGQFPYQINFFFNMGMANFVSRKVPRNALNMSIFMIA